MNEQLVGWTSNSNARGTIDIIWSCLFVVFLSTWTTMHTNVPPVKTGLLWRLRHKALLMGVGLIVPEYMATVAFTELRTALTVQSHMKNLGYQQWTLVQSFYVVMGGYMLRFNGNHKPISAENFIKWQRTGIIRVLRSTTAASGGLVSHQADGAFANSTSKPKLVRALPSGSHGLAVEIPWVSNEDIAARGKADAFLKSIACAQIGWLLMQYIARRIQSLATSSLEASTVAYVICAFFSYCAWWKKPYDLELPTTVEICSDHEVFSLVEDAPFSISINDDPDLPLLHNTFWTYVLPCTAATLSFSCLHFLAWNSHFKTLTEKWLWRASSIMFIWFHLIALGWAVHLKININLSPTSANMAKICNATSMKAIWYVIHVSKVLTFGKSKATMNQIDAALISQFDSTYTATGFLLLLFLAHNLCYVVGRLFILVEVFASLRCAPASLYKDVDWAWFIPHVH